MQFFPASDLARLRADNLELRTRRRGDARHLAARQRIAAGSRIWSKNEVFEDVRWQTKAQWKANGPSKEKPW